MPTDSDLGLVIIAATVDDFRIAAKTHVVMDEVKRRLSTMLNITDQGPARWVLNLCIRRNRPTDILKLDQQAYIEKKLCEFHLEHLPGKKILMEVDHSLSADICPKTPAEKEAVAKLPYRSRTLSFSMRIMKLASIPSPIT